jgi:hypothetical protein
MVVGKKRMKKYTVLLMLLISSFTFASGQEYTVYYSGYINGYITITKDTSGKITIMPKMKGDWRYVTLTDEICPLLPQKQEFDILIPQTQHIIIEGNITTKTYSDRPWEKTVFDGNTTTVTTGNGWWSRTVVNGNTTTLTVSDGAWKKTVVDGNITTITESDGTWEATTERIVVNGNTVTTTRIDGTWEKIVTDGNTTTLTTSDGFLRKTVVDGNITTKNDSNGNWSKEIIEKQGYSIYISREEGR